MKKLEIQYFNIDELIPNDEAVQYVKNSIKDLAGVCRLLLTATRLLFVAIRD